MTLGHRNAGPGLQLSALSCVQRESQAPNPQSQQTLRARWYPASLPFPYPPPRRRSHGNIWFIQPRVLQLPLKAPVCWTLYPRGPLSSKASRRTGHRGSCSLVNMQGLKGLTQSCWGAFRGTVALGVGGIPRGAVGGAWVAAGVWVAAVW